jgi:two-component system, chemotaxis family, sensor histidine kinase and response regulator PixL
MEYQQDYTEISRIRALFVTDVTQELESLALALAEPQSAQLMTVLPAVLRMFMRVGHDCRIAGLSTIVTLVQTALLNYPEKIVEVAHLTLAHGHQAKSIVLSGGNPQDIHPSDVLVKIAETPDDLIEISQQLAELEAQAAIPLQLELPPEFQQDFATSFTPDFASGFAPEYASQGLPNYVTDSLIQELQAVLDDPIDVAIDAARRSRIEPPSNPILVDPVEELSDSFVNHLQSMIDEPSDLDPIDGLPPTDQPQPTNPLGQRDRRRSPADSANGANPVQVRPLELASSLRQAIGQGNRKPLNNNSSDSAQSIKSRLTDYYLATTVRVDLKRLTQLHNLVGELVTQENLAQLHNQQYHGIVDSIEKRFEQFDAITQELQYWLDKSQNNRAQLAVPKPRARVVEPARFDLADALTLRKHATQEFDPLLFDQYNHLYLLAQSLMEELAQMQEAVQDIRLLTRESKYTQQKRQSTLKQVRDQLLRARMLPVADVLQRFPRMVRDLALQHNKPVKVKLSGTQTLLDKAILEKLFDPLVHLVRNSFDHGIESPTGRIAQGKPLEGTIEIRAYARGNQTYIEVRDDGRGLDCDAILRKVIDRKILTLEQAVELSPQQLYEHIFTPGFSTAAEVTELSGRGVGMDAVRTQVRQLKGVISLQSEPGKGTVFTLRFPLTLTTAMLVVFQIHNQLMALPVDTLTAVATASLDQIDLVDGKQVLLWQGKKIPLYPSEALLGAYPLAKKMPTYARYLPLSQTHEMPLLLIAGETEILALPVDRLLQEQELVVKPFGTIATPPAYFYGCTVLGDGSLVPVLDGQALITRSKTMDYHQLLQPSAGLPLDDELALDGLDGLGKSAQAVEFQKTILVVDDSLTARHFLSMTLEKSGYQVVQAKDGREALDCLSLNPDVRAVFCDVEMPRMNGFEFLENCQKKLGASAPPIIMLTSRSSEKHVQMAQSLGAKSYLTKPYLEQELLATLATCWQG